MLSPTVSKAQSFDEKGFQLYTTKNGLSDNHITGLTQDVYGYIWIATQRGLNRYDGSNYLQFFSDDRPNSLPQDRVRLMKWLHNGQLGSCTSGGLHIINTQTLQQRAITIPGNPDMAYRENSVYGVAGDNKGHVFLLTSTGFYHFDNNDKIVFRYDHYKKENASKTDLPFSRSDGIIKLTEDLFLLATTNGLYYYQVTEKKLRKTDASNDPLIKHIAPQRQWAHFMHSSNTSFSIIWERAENLSFIDLSKRKKYILNTSLTNLAELFNWRSKITQLNDTTFIITGAEKGFYLIRYNRQKDAYTILPRLYLDKFQCTSVLKDKSGNLWIGTTTGLLQQGRSSAYLKKITIGADITADNRSLNIQSVALVNNKLFVATLGQGVIVLDRKSLQLLKQIDLLKYPVYQFANRVSSLMYPGNDSIYAGTNGPLMAINIHNYQYNEANLPDWDKKHYWIANQFMDSRKNWYITSSESGSYYFREPGSRRFKVVHDSLNSNFNIYTPLRIAEDPEGNIWFGGHGFSRLNVKTKQFDFLLDSFPKVKMARKEVTEAVFDQNGKMYFGVWENGLVIYDKARDTFEHITRSQGLPDNNIRALYPLKDKLWLGTENGLASYDMRSKKIVAYGLTDDMPEGPFTAYSFFYDTLLHQLYGGFNNTVVRFNPDSLSKNESPPNFFIENIMVPGHDTLYQPTGKLELSYKRNSVIVNLGAINFEDGHLQRFAFRIVKKGDEAWIETGAQQSIVFDNLSPGAYRLQVKVYIPNNSWTEQIREITIIIHPPFWLSTAFISFCVLLLALAIVATFKLRLKRVRQKAKINLQLASLEMKSLQAQMNPHFVFNSLNSIREMILSNENKAASHFLGKFAGLIRITLDQSVKPFVSLRQTIEHLTRYIEIEQIRNEAFTCRILADDELDPNEVMLPSMLIQPFVENALWHGTTANKRNVNINIDFKKDGDGLLCIIEDDGIGINRSLSNKINGSATHKSLGLENIAHRIGLLNEKYKLKSSVRINDKEDLGNYSGTGTVVQLFLPLQINPI